MAFLCPSQLSVKKSVLQGQLPFSPKERPIDVISTTSEYTKSALKSPRSSTDSGQKPHDHKTVRIKETKYENHVERKIKSASLSKPANVRARITQDFTSSDREELNVKKGQYIIILYQQADWLFVKESSGKKGFVPYTYCSTFNASRDSKSSTSGYEESFEESDEYEQPKPHRYKTKYYTRKTYFPKRPYGPKMTVLFDYKARFENDLSVERGESAMLLNDQDPEWLWVATDDGEEGFIPRSFVISHTCEGCRNRISKKSFKNSTIDLSNDSSSKTSNQSSNPDSSSSSLDSNHSLKGTKLMALCDFEGAAFDDLTVTAGEYLYANLKDQLVPNWTWAYSPYRKRSGFVPEEYLKEPVITDI